MRDLAKGKARKARSRSRSMSRAGAEARAQAAERQAEGNAEETTLNFCCSPKGCRRDNGREVTDMDTAVKVVCTDKNCKKGVFMHEDCFLNWEDDIVKNLQSRYRQTPGRLHTWTSQQLRRDLWNKRVYDIAYRICLCSCGGYLRKDTDWADERLAEKIRNGDDVAEKKKKKKKGAVLGTDHGPKRGRGAYPKFVSENPASRQYRRAARRRDLTPDVKPKSVIIPKPSHGATGSYRSRPMSREWSPKVTTSYSFQGTGHVKTEKEYQSVTTNVTDDGNTLSPSNNTAPPSKDTPFLSNQAASSGYDESDNIPRSLVLMATYWWSNFGWRTYLDHALYANENFTADKRTQGLVTCKSVQDVERALGCRNDVAVSEMLGEWWQEVGWDEFRCFLGQQ